MGWGLFFVSKNPGDPSFNTNGMGMRVIERILQKSGVWEDDVYFGFKSSPEECLKIAEQIRAVDVETVRTILDEEKCHDRNAEGHKSTYLQEFADFCEMASKHGGFVMTH